MSDEPKPGFAWMRCSEALIRQALHMPDDAIIVGADFEWPGVVRLLVASPDLPETDANVAPDVTPTVTHVPERFEWKWEP